MIDKFRENTGCGSAAFPGVYYTANALQSAHIQVPALPLTRLVCET